MSLSFSLTTATMIPLSLILLPYFFTDLVKHREELRPLQCWKILSTCFLRGDQFQMVLEVLDMLPRGSNHCSLVDWAQNQAVSAQLCL